MRVLALSLLLMLPATAQAEVPSSALDQVWFGCLMKKIGAQSGRWEGKRTFLGMHMTSYKAQPGQQSINIADFDDPANLRLGASIGNVKQNTGPVVGLGVEGLTPDNYQIAVLFTADAERKFEASLIRYDQSFKPDMDYMYFGKCEVLRTQSEYDTLKGDLYSRLKDELGK